MIVAHYSLLEIKDEGSKTKLGTNVTASYIIPAFGVDFLHSPPKQQCCRSLLLGLF